MNPHPTEKSTLALGMQILLSAYHWPRCLSWWCGLDLGQETRPWLALHLALPCPPCPLKFVSGPCLHHHPISSSGSTGEQIHTCLPGGSTDIYLALQTCF